MTAAGSCPVFINCRDRLEPLLALLDYLERAGSERIYLLDNDSSYPPLLEFYERTSHEVVRLGENVGREALWLRGLLGEFGVSGPFVLTDPDIVPVEDCPLDAIEYFAEVLEQFPHYMKAGFGLKIDDLPDHYRHKRMVVEWESQFWSNSIAPRLYEADIDTTFALYRAGAEFDMRPSVRTGSPYLARHTTWYINSADLSAEERFYQERANFDVATWSGEAMPQRFNRHMKGLAGSMASTGLKEARDPEVVRTAAAWSREPPTVDETSFTAHAEPGWRSWNDMSPELEFCEFAVALVRMTRPAIVIETGTGQGFLTRRIARLIGPGQRLICFEADPLWREALASLSFFDASARVLSARRTPSEEELSSASLTLLDSKPPLRLKELETWWRVSRSGALVLVHDAGNGHPPDTIHVRVRTRIGQLGIPGVFLDNPRGGFLGLKP